MHEMEASAHHGMTHCTTRRSVEMTIDGKATRAPEGSTILDACKMRGIDLPTLCFAENLTPVNVCRICVVEVEGARVLAPACSRKVEAGMKISTTSERVASARRLVIELIASSVDVSTAPAIQEYLERYDAHPERFGSAAENVHQPTKIDNDLYVRDYGKCMLCYKCVEACGTDAQSTFAIAIAGRGMDARVSTELDVPLTESACVYCGNCIGVCPTGALMFKSEYDLRARGAWNEGAQKKVDTVCPYCGVGCALTLHVQDNRIEKVTSPVESSVTHGHLCIKGRFGFDFVQTIGNRAARSR